MLQRGRFLADEHHDIVNAADKAGDRKVIDDTGISGAAVEGNIPRGNAHQCEGEDGGVEVFFGGAADPDFHHLPVTDGKSAQNEHQRNEAGRRAHQSGKLGKIYSPPEENGNKDAGGHKTGTGVAAVFSRGKKQVAVINANHQPLNNKNEVI